MYVQNTYQVWFERCNVFREAYYLLPEYSWCILEELLFLLKNIFYINVAIEKSTQTHKRIGRRGYFSHFFYATNTPKARTSVALGIY